jgi:hypothetical protein
MIQLKSLEARGGGDARKVLNGHDAEEEIKSRATMGSTRVNGSKREVRTRL